MSPKLLSIAEVYVLGEDGLPKLQMPQSVKEPDMTYRTVIA